MIKLIVLATCAYLGFSVLLYRAMFSIGGLRGRTALSLGIAGAAAAAPVLLLLSYTLDSLGWTMMVNTSGTAVAFAAAALIVAPIEQATLMIVVWPVYRAHRLERVGTAISAGVIAAAGYGVVHAAARMASATSAWILLEVFAAFVTRVLCAALWASFLSTSRAHYRHYLPLAWLFSSALDGFLRHLQVGRGSGWQLLALPLLAALFLYAWLARRRYSGQRDSMALVRQSRLGILVDAHGIGTVRAAWQHAHRPALLHWIVGGAFVSFGANIVGLVVGISIAHLLHIDLSRVNETDAGAMVPLILLSATVLFSYPVAAYLTAKASDADSVFEPGVAALISIAAVTILLSLTAPVTLVLAVALAPIAFGLSCLGAWLGLSASDEQSQG